MTGRRPDALAARNIKNQWEQSWKASGNVDIAQKAALASGHLEKAFELYRQGFIEDRNHFYSGLNALAMVTMLTELAQAQAAIWEDGFDTKEDASQKLQKLKELRGDLAAGVRLAIESKQFELRRTNKSDVWVEISTADLICLTSNRPNRVGQAYNRALSDASDHARDAVRRQLLLYQRLGILKENIQAGLDNIALGAEQSQIRETPPRVLLFTGHRVDAPDRKSPRFPAAKEKQARAIIVEAVTKEAERSKGNVLGISGGASGGDILFHEVCEELNISSRMYLGLAERGSH